MARKTKEVLIGPNGGRDSNKRFLLTEMSASQAEAWAYRAFSAMARSGIDIPPHIAQMGMYGILAMGAKALLGVEFGEAKPLFDEMMACVQSVQPAMTRPLVEDDIEDYQTRIFLRSEVFELHTGFSPAAYLSKIWEAAATKLNPTSDLPNIQTSPDASEPSSQAA